MGYYWRCEDAHSLGGLKLSLGPTYIYLASGHEDYESYVPQVTDSDDNQGPILRGRIRQVNVTGNDCDLCGEE